MKKFIITEEERRSILKQHILKGYKSKLNEQDRTTEQKIQEFIKLMTNAASGNWLGAGTNEDKMVAAFAYLTREDNFTKSELDSALERLEGETIDGRNGLGNLLDSELGLYNLDTIEEINKLLYNAGARFGYDYTPDGKSSVKDIKFSRSPQRKKSTIESSFSDLENYNKFKRGKEIKYSDDGEYMYFTQDGENYALSNSKKIFFKDKQPQVDYKIKVERVGVSDTYELVAEVNGKVYSLKELFKLTQESLDSESNKTKEQSVIDEFYTKWWCLNYEGYKNKKALQLGSGKKIFTFDAEGGKYGVYLDDDKVYKLEKKPGGGYSVGEEIDTIACPEKGDIEINEQINLGTSGNALGDADSESPAAPTTPTAPTTPPTAPTTPPTAPTTPPTAPTTPASPVDKSGYGVDDLLKGKTIRKGNRSEVVRIIKSFLQEKMPNHFTELGLEVNDVYDPKTVGLIAYYQAKNGLKVDGITGPETMRSLSTGVDTEPETT